MTDTAKVKAQDKVDQPALQVFADPLQALDIVSHVIDAALSSGLLKTKEQAANVVVAYNTLGKLVTDKQ